VLENSRTCGINTRSRLALATAAPCSSGALHSGLVTRTKTQRHPAAVQKIMLRQTQLQSVVTEDVTHRTVKKCLLARQHIAALRRGEPLASNFALLPYNSASSTFQLPCVRHTAIPALRDNYIWAIHNGQHATVIDPGEAAPVLAFLDAQGLLLNAILCTHRHADHVGGHRKIARSIQRAGVRAATSRQSPYQP